MRHYGIGRLTSITTLAELGDARRSSSSREVVRYAGMDITVHQSDARRAMRAPDPLTRPRLLPTHHLADPEPRIADRDTAGRPRAHRTRLANHAHAPPPETG